MHHKMSIIFHINFVIFIIFISSGNSWASSYFCEQEIKFKKPIYAPKYSDVSMRLVRRYDGQKEILMGQAFHITRADWSYIRSKKYIKKIHELGWTFQGTLNAITKNKDHALRRNGSFVKDHFQKPGRYIADCTNSDYRQWYLNRILNWIDLGVDSLQRDEPNGFGHWPHETAVDFYREIHGKVEKISKKQLPLSLNLSWNNSGLGGKGESITQLFDFGMAELSKKNVNPSFLWRSANDARQRGQFLVYTARQHLNMNNYRKAIASCYANGMLFIVPWDQYAGVRKERVFLQPKDVADLYGFVRANSMYLDNHEEMAVAGYGLEKFSDSSSPSLKIINGTKVSAWLRINAQKCTSSPIVIHLIDWGSSGSFTIALPKLFFSPQSSIEVFFQYPPEYDPDIHWNSEKQNNYENLSSSKKLKVSVKDDFFWINVPSVNPWGMLIISEKK